MKLTVPLSETAQNNMRRWLNDTYDEETKQSIRNLLENDPQNVEEAFYTSLSFGTGGIRGLMGVGSNRMNVYTVAELTQGLVNYIYSMNVTKPLVAIGYDTRNNSRLFAEQVAKCVVSNGGEAFLFDTCCPTPLLSFAVRYLECHAGVMITASHNPPEYNGFKVYWSDGAQVLHPHDQAICEEIDRIRIQGLLSIHCEDSAKFTSIGRQVIQSYLQEIKKLMLFPQGHDGKRSLKILYTSLHGTGGVVMEDALRLWGMSSISTVRSQMVMDGNFPTTKSPNPENKEALALGIDQMLKEEHDIFLATDPDADRVAVVVRHQGKPYILSGNQTAAIMSEWICRRLYEEGKMPLRPALIKTIVTTPLLDAIALYWNVKTFDVLTGFKYIAEKIRFWEKDPSIGYSFVFGGEESLGYLYGTNSRDKDGIVSSCVISEIAAQCKKEKKTLVDALHDIWKKYGVFIERLKTVQFSETKEGKELMRLCMNRLRNIPPQSVGNKKVVAFEDLLQGSFSGDKTACIAQGLPSSDVLLIHLEEGGLLCIRPSGTEPKVKIYAMMQKKSCDSVIEAEQVLEKEVYSLLDECARLMKY